MDFIENIEYRQELNKKVAAGKKLTPSEKEWCKTNPVYNGKYTEPCYQRDIIQLSPNSSYNIKVTLEYSPNDNIFFEIVDVCSPNPEVTIPTIGIPWGRGEIKAHIIDQNPEEKTSKKVKFLGVLISKLRPTSSFVLNSEHGYMSIEYKHQYFKEKMKLYTRESSVLNFAYGMKKELVSDNKVRYTCKNPLADHGVFDDLIFSVEWVKI